MKTLVRFICLVLMLSGWALAALCLHVVRTPDPQNPKESKLLVVPKNRLGVNDTYVDAREWKMSDVPNHSLLVLRLLRADKAEQLKFLGDPGSKKDIEAQLIDALSEGGQSPLGQPAATSRTSIRPAGFTR